VQCLVGVPASFCRAVLRFCPPRPSCVYVPSSPYSFLLSLFACLRAAFRKPKRPTPDPTETHVHARPQPRRHQFSIQRRPVPPSLIRHSLVVAHREACTCTCIGALLLPHWSLHLPMHQPAPPTAHPHATPAFQRLVKPMRACPGWPLTRLRLLPAAPDVTAPMISERCRGKQG